MDITTGEWRSFLAGVATGGRLSTPVKSGARRSSSITTISTPRRIGAREAISLHVGRVNGVRGQLVKVPVFISNNNVNENGVGLAGFISSMRFDSHNLAYVGVLREAWDGSFVVNETGVSRGSIVTGKQIGRAHV